MTILLLILAMAAPFGAGAQSGAERLEYSKTAAREIASGQAHSYEMALTVGQFVRVTVAPQDIDVALYLYGPDGRQLTMVDGLKAQASELPDWVAEPAPLETDEEIPSRRPARSGVRLNLNLFGRQILGGDEEQTDNRGVTESLIWVAAAAGSYRLEVRALGEQEEGGGYQIMLAELRAATLADESEVAAQAAFEQGARRTMAAQLRDAAVRLSLMRKARSPRQEAIALNDIGLVYYRWSRKHLALNYFNRALALFRELEDLEGESIALNNVGLLYREVGDSARALETLHQVLALLEREDNPALRSSALHNIALVYDDANDKQQALDYYSRALAAARETGDPDDVVLTLSNTGNLYKSLGDYDKALYYFNEGLTALGKRQRPSAEFILLSNIGEVYNARGQTEEALKVFNRLLATSRTQVSRSGEALALDNLGRVYAATGDFARALEYFQRARTLRKELEYGREEAGTLNHLAEVYYRRGDLEAARAAYQEALALMRANKDLSGEAVSRYGLALLARAGGDLAGARAHIEAVIAIVEELRAKVPGEELRASYFATVQDYYSFYIDLLMHLDELNPAAGHAAAALEASERARARALCDLLLEARVDIYGRADAALLARARGLRQLLNARAAALARLKAEGEEAQVIAVAAREVDTLLLQYQEAEAQIRASNPQYAALIRPNILKSAEMQALLDDDTLLLTFALGERRSFLWLVTKSALQAYRLPARAQIEAQAREVYRLLTARQPLASEPLAQYRARVERSDADYPRAAAALSQMLLGSVAAQLGNKRLIIVADSALQFIPFAALPVPGEGGGAPLISAHEIVHLPSASSFAVLRQQYRAREPAGRSVAVFADPVFEQNDIRIKPARRVRAARLQQAAAKPSLSKEQLLRSARESDSAAGTRFGRLLFSAQEAAAIATQAAGSDYKLAVGFAANRAAATSAELDQYRYVHFATHGLLNSAHPELSGIVLSLFDERGEPQDGFLRLNDLYNMRLQADMVVLSGCQTALGKQIRGEGLISITRGFMHAGAARVLASLWKVDDSATAEWMKLFYQGILSEKLTPAAALRRAQLAMMEKKRWQAPYYWAAFTLQGEWR